MDRNNSNFTMKFKYYFKRNLYRGCFILILFSVLILFVVIGDFFKVLKSPIQLETFEQAKNLKSGDVVKLDITMTGGDIMKETKTYSNNNTEETARYYAVPFINSNNSKLWYVTVKLDSNEFFKAEKAKTAFENFIKTKKEPTEVMLSVYGVVKDMNDEEKKYVTTDLTKVMDTIYIDKLSKTRTLVLTGVVILIIVLSVSYIVYYTKVSKKKEARLKEEMKANNQAPQNIDVQ